MINKRYILLLTAILAPVTSEAGRAIFDPPVQILSPPGQTSVSFDITLVSQTLPNFDSFDVVILGAAPFAFEWNPEIVSDTTDPLPVEQPCMLCLPGFPADIYLGNATGVPGGFGNSVLLGSITINTRDLEAPGTFEFVISSEMDGISVLGRQGISEPIAGRGKITIPDPTRLSFLLLPSAFLIRRKRT